MLKRIFNYILLVPPAIAVVILAVANRHSVTLSLDPFAPETPAFALEAPLFWLLFAALFIGIMLGGFGAWIKQRKWRLQARDKRREAEKLRVEAERLRDITQGTGAPGLPAPNNKRAA